MAYTPKLTYKGRPLVRCGNDIYYGSMKDPFVVYLQVLSTKKENGVDVADKVHIVLLSTDEKASPCLSASPVRPTRSACTMRCPSVTLCCRAHCRRSKHGLLPRCTAPGYFCGGTMKKRQHAAALLGTLVCLVLALVLYHSLAGGTLMQAGPYNSYALQAENWLAGRNYIANGEDYPWLELAIYNGRYYQSFPPVPAVLMLPFVAAFGSWQALPGGLIMLELALLCAAGVYLCCMRSGMAADVCAYFAVFISMGSNLFWMSTSDGVWFMAQLCGLLFAVWGLYWAQGRGAVQAALASLCMALAVGCRPFYALLLACWMAWRAYKTRSVRALLPALLPAVAVAVCMMVYNWVRFGSVVEFGHNYLPEFTRAEHGQFSLHYLLPNLRQLLPCHAGRTGTAAF